jgi:DNA-binding NtrC family response regulator
MYDPQAAADKIDPSAGLVCTAKASSSSFMQRAAGTYGFIEKPYRANALLAAVRLATASSVAEPSQRLRYCRSKPEHRLLGNSTVMKAVLHRIGLYAQDESPVLIMGESGTGKELAAAAIHASSRRRHGTFLPIDCASITESLVESTLFGTVKGAFTDALEKKGAFESARGGTIFLDEIGELSFSLQAKFLRTLETESGCRVGSVTPVSYDARIVSATNVQLYGDRRSFRPELLNRLDTLVLRMPALREHKDDIELLAEAFLSTSSPGKNLSVEALRRLSSWDWPGNVRELRNVVRRAAVLSGGRHEIIANDIEFYGKATCWQASLF